MRLLPIGLLIVCLSANSAWVSIGESESGNMEIFIDPKLIRKESTSSFTWLLKNFNTPYNGAMSHQTYNEIDCLKKRLRTLQLSQHSEQWAKGKVIFTAQYPNSDWVYAPPGSGAAVIVDVVCTK